MKLRRLTKEERAGRPWASVTMVDGREYSLMPILICLGIGILLLIFA